MRFTIYEVGEAEPLCEVESFNETTAIAYITGVAGPGDYRAVAHAEASERTTVAAQPAEGMA